MIKKRNFNFEGLPYGLTESEYDGFWKLHQPKPKERSSKLLMKKTEADDSHQSNWPKPFDGNTDEKIVA